MTTMLLEREAPATPAVDWEVVYQRPVALNDLPTHYCPG